MLWNDLLGIERFPAWWVDMEDIPPENTVVPDLDEGYYAREKPWRPTVVVPWVEFRDKTQKGTMFVQPTPQPLAYFEHDGLAGDFACALAYSVGHIAGRKPEDWEQPWAFNQFYVYSRMTPANLWNNERFPAWCKTHAPVFTAALGHGGVTHSVSETGFASDNAEIPLTTEVGEKIIKGFIYRSGAPVKLAEMLDAPPTPKTQSAMMEDFPHEIFNTAADAQHTFTS